jgi:CMP-N-acetylneuraminate monooxygenase
VFASSFAGGASSYPLCFDTVDNKAEVVDTLLTEVKSDVIKAVKKVMPKYFLPYAGFATPILAQDKFIKDNDKLLTPDDYTRTIGRTLVDVLDVRKADTFVFDGGNLLETSQIKRERASTVQQAEQLYERGHRDIISANEVIQYFIHSAYRDELIVYLELTDPHFNPLVGISYEGNNLLKFIIDFTHPLSCIQKDFDFKTEKKKQKKERMLHLKIRADAATPVLRKRMPLDDLLIGYHCRIDREPDVYNKKFWHHFTNIYIS